MSLGVIGGLGPMATAYYLELVVRMTDVRRDQDHPEIILMNIPSIPDRTAYILGKSEENPLIPMVEAGKKMKELGATVVATPCVTAHYFHEDLQSGIGLPVIHVIRKTAELLCQAGVRQVGLMATDGTVQSGLYDAALKNAGIIPLYPDPEEQKMIMSMIYDYVKAGKAFTDLQRVNTMIDRLRKQGAQGLILGCTELPIAFAPWQTSIPAFDPTLILARAAITAAGYQTK